VADPRLVDVYAGGLFWSGYLIAPRLVLTAAHGLPDADNEPANVRRLADRYGYASQVVWRNPAPAVDQALLVVVDPIWDPPDLPPQRWGYLREDDSSQGPVVYRCYARGFPAAQARDGGVRDTEALEGLIRLDTASLSGTLQVQIITGDLGPVANQSGWKGMSGAAVLCGGLLVGVLVEDTPNIPSRLTATRITSLLADPEAARILAAHDVPVETAPASPNVDLVTPGFRPVKPASPPRQLPPPPRSFTGRHSELGQLTAALNEDTGEGAAIVISAVGGIGGIGKTWLTLQWGHQNVARFPDGQLFVNLRGFDPSGEPMAATEAVRGFLDALGVAPDAVPADLAAQVGLYRSLVADKQMLIVLDNARDAVEVSSLLPGTPSCCVLITSRVRLTELTTTHDARQLALDVLTDDESRELLARRVGLQRLNAEPAAAAALIAFCSGLPLALGIVGSRIGEHADFPLATWADELRDTATRLKALDAGGPTASLAAVLSWSFDALSVDQANLFCLLGLAPGPDISLRAIISLSARPDSWVAANLGALERQHLLQQHVPGRYRMHDLVRLFAAERANRHQTKKTREAALRRIADFYVHTAHGAARLLFSHTPGIDLGLRVRGSRVHLFSNAADASDWMMTEHRCLLATQQLAIDRGWFDHVWQLAWSLDTFDRRRGNLHDCLETWRAGLAAAEQSGRTAAQILAHRGLGYAYALLSRHPEALTHLSRSVTLAERIGDLPGLAHAHRALAQTWGIQGDHKRAMEHDYSALQVAQALGHEVWQARALNNLGRHRARLGQYQQARMDCEAALELCRANQHREGEAFTLDGLGYIAQSTHDYTQALDYYKRALALFLELGHTYNEANTLERLGLSYVAVGQRQQAHDAWRQALTLYSTQHRLADAERVRRHVDDATSEGDFTDR